MKLWNCAEVDLVLIFVGLYTHFTAYLVAYKNFNSIIDENIDWYTSELTQLNNIDFHWIAI